VERLSVVQRIPKEGKDLRTITLASPDLSSQHPGMDFTLSQVALAAASLASQQAAQDGTAVRPLGADSGGMAAMGHERHSNAPARDGNVAIREELETARLVRTVAAYDLFIARHPRHPLSGAARREREALRAAKSGPARPR
jgi:hypothetical protein